MDSMAFITGYSSDGLVLPQILGWSGIGGLPLDLVYK